MPSWPGPVRDPTELPDRDQTVPGGPRVDPEPWRGNDQDVPRQLNDAGFGGGFGGFGGGVVGNSRDGGKKASAGSVSRRDRWFQNGRR